MNQISAGIKEQPHTLPQDWPEHLSPDAKIFPIETVPPNSGPLLDFASMHHSTFEQFCWWLLKKDHRLKGCKRIGNNGREQGGIDLFAFDEQQTKKLHVFECKAWKDYSPSKLREAVDAFFLGSWVHMTNNFTIILAQEDCGLALAKCWLEQMQRLKQAGIEGELWTAHNLTLKVQPYPDILSKFFAGHSIELYANKWMQRVNFYELVSKSFFDPRERIAQWARELMSQSNGHDAIVAPILSQGQSSTLVKGSSESDTEGKRSQPLPFAVDGIFRNINRYGSSWHFNGPWFSLNAILPDQRFTQASVAITFNRPDMQGITLTIDHSWLLRRFLFSTQAPLIEQYRGFIVGNLTAEGHSRYLIDLPHCRLFLEEEGAHEIAAVADLLTDEVRNSLNALETEWSAQDFPFIQWAGKKVGLATINAKVWQEIGQFIETHDYEKGDTPWHMFNGNRQILMPFHKTANEQFDAGLHAVIHAVKIDGLSFDDEVVLLWQPRDVYSDHQVSQRGWWSCEFVFQWLKEALLPEIKRRVYKRKFGGRWKQVFRSQAANSFAEYLDELFTIRDLRERPLIRDGQWSDTIVESIRKLQYFFHAIRAPAPYIRECEMKRLYKAAGIIAQGKRGYLGYIKSKLALHRSPEDHADLINTIDEYIIEGRVIANSCTADRVFRAMLEMLKGSDTFLSNLDQTFIRDSLKPFALLHDNAILVKRHTEWV